MRPITNWKLPPYVPVLTQDFVLTSPNPLAFKGNSKHSPVHLSSSCLVIWKHLTKYDLFQILPESHTILFLITSHPTYHHCLASPSPTTSLPSDGAPGRRQGEAALKKIGGRAKGSRRKWSHSICFVKSSTIWPACSWITLIMFAKLVPISTLSCRGKPASLH